MLTLRNKETRLGEPALVHAAVQSSSGDEAG